MNTLPSSPTTLVPSRSPRLFATAAIFAAGIGLFGFQSFTAYQLFAARSLPATSVPSGTAMPTPGLQVRLSGADPRDAPATPPLPHAAADDYERGDSARELGEADGVIDGGVPVFAGDQPAVANLELALLAALRQAATDAAADGIELVITSGWRSAEYQDLLLQAATVEYGSAAEAARWVATAETSAHVTGEAVDLGPEAALTWLTAHGARYGLCQIYDNEPWHFELRLAAASDGCPPRYADPTEDPRMRP